jgi:hypothetical protein
MRMLFAVLVAVLVSGETFGCSACATAASRFNFAPSYVWDLTQARPGLVEDGAILWVAGKPCKSNPRAFDIIRQAFQQWSSIPGSKLKFRELTGVTADPSKHTIVSFESGVLTMPALGGTVTFDLGTATMRGLIRFNDDTSWGDGLVLNLALHEIGHLIGLGHTTDKNTLMYSVATSISVITPDEKSAARTLYPEAGYVQPFGAAADASPKTGGAPLGVMFNAFGSDGDITSYSWNFGDGTSDVNGQASHTYNSPGTYTASLTVTDKNGQSQTAQVVIVVQKDNREAPAVTKRLSLNFKTYKDTLALKISSTDFNPSVKAVAITVAGQPVTAFTFRAGRGKASLTVKGKLSDILMPLGAVNATVSGAPLEIPYTVETSQFLYVGTASMTYSAKAGKTGKGR